MIPSFRTVLFGFGKIGGDYATDPLTARHYSYATHAQALDAHPDFDWGAVVDSSEEALEKAVQRWKIPIVASDAKELAEIYKPEVAVIATPPLDRIALIDQLPTLRAVLVEKPLGMTTSEEENFLQACRQRDILVQVNYWRRADTTFRALADGKLNDLIGTPQAVFGVYGNGLLNNGAHLIDFTRMLFGEVEKVQAVCGCEPTSAEPLPGDVDLPFNLRTTNGLMFSMHPIEFSQYREIGLDIWGRRGRLTILNEGLRIFFYPRSQNRAIQDEMELNYDKPELLESTVGQALYQIYGNLAMALKADTPLWSPGESARKTRRVVQAILNSAQSHGMPVAVA